MKTVLYGTNTKALYEAEQKLLQSLSQSEFQFIDLRKTSISQLQEELGTQTMFAQPRLWRLSKLESLRSPKQKQEVVALLTATADDVIISVPQELTPAQKKLFDPKLWKLQEFKLPKVFFQLTEAIKVKSLKDCHSLLAQALEQKNEWELHALLARQFRLLLAVKTGAPVQAPPFAKKALEAQARKFSAHELVSVIHALFTLEWDQKSGRSKRTWHQEFDRLLLKIYDTSGE